MKTTPTEVLEVALYQAPLDLVAIETVELTAYRLKCQGEWRNVVSGHTKLTFLQKYPYTLNQDRILKKYQLVKSYKIRIPTRQVWQEPETIIDQNVDHWYTDGSGIQNCFGAGIYGPSYDYRESIPLGSHTSWTDEETQRNSNDLHVARVLHGTPRLRLLLLLD
jgi:hypothetical protein